jgi:hypothetical protein
MNNGVGRPFEEEELAKTQTKQAAGEGIWSIVNQSVHDLIEKPLVSDHTIDQPLQSGAVPRFNSLRNSGRLNEVGSKPASLLPIPENEGCSSA